MLTPYKKIKLHSSDIKDIYFDTNLLITIGRDSILKIISTDKNITKEINQGYLNSLAVKLPHIFIGTQSGTLCVYNLMTDDLFKIKIHENNICTMKIKEKLLITGSWDNSVKVINLLKLIQNKEEIIFYEKYKCTVLSVNFYKTGLITGLENGMINFYKKKEKSFEKINEFYLHNHPIRDLFVKDESIKSISVSLIESNEKKVKNFIDFDNFMFSCTEKMVVGDTGLIVYEEKSYQIPVETIWKIIEVNNTYLLACSDGYVYIFNQPIFLNFQNEEDFQVNEYIKNQEEFQNEELSEDYKIEDGIIYQKVGDNFIKLGKIKYDSSFTIEIENRNINVEFNKNESPTDIAARIIKEKKINPIYKEEISDFIKKNFKKEESFKYFTSLPKEKVIPLLQTKPNLTKLICEEKTDLKKVQEELNDLFKESKFLFLDLLRYFYSKNLKFNINFLFDYQPDYKNSKECLAYVRLITNLFGKINLNLEMFRRIMMDILDYGLVDKGKFYEYEFNRQVILKK